MVQRQNTRMKKQMQSRAKNRIKTREEKGVQGGNVEFKQKRAQGALAEKTASTRNSKKQRRLPLNPTLPILKRGEKEDLRRRGKSYYKG